MLVIDAEQGLKTIKRRLHEARLEECEAIDYVRVPDGLSLDSNDEHAAMVEALLAEGDYALVFADPSTSSTRATQTTSARPSSS